MKNMMFSGNENIDYSQSTKKTFGSRKLFLFVMAVLASVSDFALLVVFAISGHGGIAIPVILLILDGLFIAGVCLSNFRFKYSIGIWVSYIIVSVIVTAFLALLDAGETYMTTTAKCLNVFSHIALYLVTIFASIYPLIKSNMKLRAVMITCVTVAVVLVGAFAVFFSANGYFGQGFLGESRVVGYTLDEESDTYIASSVKSGRSKKVVIPSEFNGKKVSGVDCGLFTDNTVNTVEILTEDKITLLNPRKIENINPNIKIGVDRKYIDLFRQKCLTQPSAYGIDDDSMVTFTNSLYPINLESDEVFVTFKYQDYPKQEEIIPTWIGKAGQTFSLDYANVNYLQHANAKVADDLVWCYYNNDTQILTGEIVNLVGKKINESQNSVKVEFENVYRFTVADDNDGVYEPADSFKTTLSNNELYAYRFFTISGAVEHLENLSNELIEDRDNGFDLTWQYNLNEISNSWQDDNWYDFFDLTLNLYQLSEYRGDEVNIKLKPIWSLKKPTDLKITYFDNKVNYIYGDDVRMDVSAEAPLKGCQLSYEWYWAGDVYGDGEDNARLTGSTYTINNAFPQEGIFRVYVTASYPEVTDLESFDTLYVPLTVDKRPLNITWEEPADMVYDSYEKVLKHYVGNNELINGDILVYNLTETNVRNTDAGSYTASLSLYGVIDEMYKIATGATHSYTIAPRPVQTQWTCEDLTYDGNPHNAVATAQGVNGYNIPIYLSSDKTNAGKYTATASSRSANYVLTDNTYPFEIKQKSVTVGAWSSTTFTYNGTAQYPRVTSINGLVGNESITNQLIYSGYASNINAGEGYSVSVTLPTSSNYKFDSAQSTQYNIAKKALSVRPNVASKTYDGYTSSLDITASGLVGSHTNSSLGTPTYGGNGVNAVDVGTYSVTVTLPDNEVTKNYEITYASASFTISKRVLQIRAVASNKTYDGKVNTFDFEVVSGLASAHTKSSLGMPTYSGSGVNAVDAGSYSVSVSLPDNDVTKNYNISYTGASFTISKAQVALVWSNAVVSGGRVTAPSVVTSGQVYSGDITVGSYTYRDSSGRVINSIPAVSGTYSVEVVVTSGNYSFTNTRINFSITVSQTQNKEVA